MGVCLFKWTDFINSWEWPITYLNLHRSLFAALNALVTFFVFAAFVIGCERLICHVGLVLVLFMMGSLLLHCWLLFGNCLWHWNVIGTKLHLLVIVYFESSPFSPSLLLLFFLWFHCILHHDRLLSFLIFRLYLDVDFRYVHLIIRHIVLM